MLLIKHLAIVRFAFNDSKDEGKTAGAEEVYDVPESRWNIRSGERFDLTPMGESKSE